MSNLYDNEFDAPLDLDLYGNPVIQSNLEPITSTQNMSERSPSIVPSDNPAEDEKRKVIQDYLQKKYDKATVASDKSSSLVDGFDVANDGSGVASAKNKQRQMDIAAALGEGIVGAFGSGTPGKAYMKGWGQTGAPEFTKSSMVQFDAQPIRDLGARGVVDAETKKQEAIKNYLLRDKLSEEDKSRKVASDKFNRLNDPNSPDSVRARALSKKFNPAAKVDGLSAAQLQDILPYDEKMYGIDQQRLIRQESAAQRQQDRLDRRADKALERELKQENKMMELTIPGVGIARNIDDAKKIKDATELKKKFDRQLNELIELRKNNGVEYFDREAVGRGKQLASDLKLTYKDMSKLGVLSESDNKILNAIIPEDPTGQDWMPGQDAILNQLEKFKQDSESDYQTRLNTRLQERQGTPTSGNQEQPKPSWAK